MFSRQEFEQNIEEEYEMDYTEKRLECLQGQEAVELVIRLLNAEPWVITRDRLEQPVRLSKQEFVQIVEEHGDVELFYPDWQELFIASDYVVLAAGGIREDYKTIFPEELGFTEELQVAKQIEQLWENVDSMTPLSHIRQFGDEQNKRRAFLEFLEQEAGKNHHLFAQEVERWYNAYRATWEEAT